MSVRGAQEELRGLETHLDNASRDLEDLKDQLNDLEPPEITISMDGRCRTRMVYDPAKDLTKLTIIPGE